MADISNEYGVDPLTGDRIAIDPPLQESETPLMGNPVLMRREAPRRARSNTALYAGVAVIALLAGGAYLFASGAHQSNDLMTKAEMTPPAQQQAAAMPAPAPLTSSPVATPTPPSAPVVASAEKPVQPLHAPRTQRAEAARHVERREAARAADESGADAAASVTPSQVVQPAVATPQPAPAPIAPAAAPVVTPPAP
jgi:hypothetical protein